MKSLRLLIPNLGLMFCILPVSTSCTKPSTSSVDTAPPAIGVQAKRGDLKNIFMIQPMSPLPIPELDETSTVELEQSSQIPREDWPVCVYGYEFNTKPYRKGRTTSSDIAQYFAPSLERFKHDLTLLQAFNTGVTYPVKAGALADQMQQRARQIKDSGLAKKSATATGSVLAIVGGVLTFDPLLIAGGAAGLCKLTADVRTIHPQEKSLEALGHEIKEICTEEDQALQESPAVATGANAVVTVKEASRLMNMRAQMSRTEFLLRDSLKLLDESAVYQRLDPCVKYWFEAKEHLEAYESAVKKLSPGDL